MDNELDPQDANSPGEGSEDPVQEAQDKATQFLELIQAREKEFTSGWWKKAEKAYDIYSADQKNVHEDEIPYNILYSNTEVLLPSLYSATPKPDVRARFKDQQLKPLPDLIERFLTISVDSGAPGAETLHGSMLDCTLSSLVPGMGYVRLRLRPELAFPLTYESGHYKTLIWGKAARWSKVPWIAFKHQMKKDQMFKQFDISKEDQTGYTATSEDQDDKDSCCVYEVWDKATRTVMYISEEWSERLLKTVPDPLGLQNFFPTPGPLILTAKPGKLTPTPLYNFYRNQAEELNRVSVRLNKVLSAIRVRGAYNSLLGEDLKRMLSSDELENELIPAAEAGLLAQSGGFDKHIWMLPIEKLITVAQELYKAREAVKQVIYELTGISDIIRGSSVSSETATAQSLKNKWGTVRLRRMQSIIADYARDLFRLTIDCASDHISAQQWKEVTQLQLPLQAEKQAAQQRLQQLQTMQPPMTMPMPGQPPQPAPVNPEVQNLQQLLAQPSMEDLLSAIKSDQHRTFVVNIQTSSTVDLDTAQDKAEVGEFMNAMGQLMAGLQPLMAFGPSGIETVKAILIAVCQRYKFGIDIVDTIMGLKMPPPPPPEPPKGPPPPSPLEIQAQQGEAQLKLAKIASDMRILQAQEQLALAEISAKQKQLSIDIDLAQLRVVEQQSKMRARAQAPQNPAN
jgi:hypothetical protein